MNQRRVVVTGLGAITPLGLGVNATWDRLVAGESGIRKLQRFDASPYEVRIGGECSDFVAEAQLDRRAIKRMDRVTQLALVAGEMSFKDAGLEPGRFEPTRAGVILGSGIGGLEEIETQHCRLLEKGPDKVSAFTIPKLMANAGSGMVSIALNFQAVNTTVATACASAGNAMGDAYHAIRRGEADVIVAGGSEAAVTPLGVAAFAAMKALSTRNDDPAHASRPFDKDRDGFVLSEGAGMLIFEDYEHAQARGANILAEVVGVAATADAGDMVQPDPEGRGAGRAMAAALQSAQLNPEDIDYINAHGTSTPLGDVAETRAIKRVFGNHAHKLLVSSTKSAIGHTLGASGGVEAIVCILALRNRTAPPTINLETPDPDCDLDYVPNVARDANIRYAMSNSFGFGGHNASLIFKRI